MSEASIKGARAKALLNDDLLNEALDNVQRFHVELIAGSSAGQSQEREHSCYMIKAIAELKGELQNYITSASIDERKSK